MTRKGPNQPELGELFAASSLRQVLTVSQITGSIRRLLESQIGRVWITGEVTNLRAQSSGHLYFTLKDASAQISCVLFRGEAAATRQFVQDGQSLLLGGELTVYEPRGQYQLKIMSVELQGVGALQLAFEQLKKKLHAEGLFAPERKRPLPRYPQRIGLVTSPTGAAIRDVLHVILRRQPSLEIVLAPVRVQGQGAAQEIAQAIRDLNAVHASGTRCLDLILITRGGGSLEDLWAFNEEAVARAVYASALPVVSAVGHEIDVTISDWVADLRAATPTAAAELITEGPYSSRQFLTQVSERLSFLVQRQLREHLGRADQLQARLARVSPRRWLEEKSQFIDDGLDSMHRSARTSLRVHQADWESLSRRLSALRPSRLVVERRKSLTELARRLRTAAQAGLPAYRSRLELLCQQLELLSPLNVLHRGYSITRDAKSGDIVRSAPTTYSGQSLITRFADGEVRSDVVSE